MLTIGFGLIFRVTAEPTPRLFGAKTESGVTTPVGNPPIPASAANYLRLSRVGNTWTAEFSPDGTNWLEEYRFSFDHSLTISAMGPFVADPGAGGKPTPGLYNHGGLLLQRGGPAGQR